MSIHQLSDKTLLFIHFLRDKHKVNIKTAVELGFSGRDDRFHFQEAKRQRRVLLTCDKDFLDHSKFPFHQMIGVVILDPPQEYGLGWMSLWIESEITSSGREIEGTKIVVHRDTLDVHFVDDSGKIEKQVLRVRDEYDKE